MSRLWHDVDRPRTFYTMQNDRQEHCKHRSHSGQHVSSLHDIAQEGPAGYLLQISVFTRVLSFWTGITDNVPDDILHHVK
jgi:hypothetical protein